MVAISPSKAMQTTAMPVQPISVSGFEEKPNMPSAASLSIFLRVYFVLPAHLSSRTYSTGTAL